MKPNFRKYTAEMIGTFVLVFVAVGTAVFTYIDSVTVVAGVAIGGQVNLVATALAFGLVIVAMAYAIGPISGCHINPAVTLGVFAAGRGKKRMSVVDLCGYIVAQVIGAIIGAAVLFGIVRMMGVDNYILGANAYEHLADTIGAAIGIALIVEIILTAIFVFTILCVVAKSENGRVAGLVIGLTLTLVHLIGINLTGTSVNPARSLGPALFDGVESLRQVWLFIVAPLAGALIAALAFRCLYQNEETEEAK